MSARSLRSEVEVLVKFSAFENFTAYTSRWYCLWCWISVIKLVMETTDARQQSITQSRSFFKLALTWISSPLAILYIVSFSTLWLGLDATRLWDRDEPRNARCATEMLERADWVVPMFNNQLRTHKPILLYWMQMVCFSVFGETDFAARAASAYMASLAVFATYWLGKSLIDPKAGFWSAIVLATSLMFVVAGRAATPDACLVATSTLGIVALVMHWQSASTKFTKFAVAGYTSLGFAVLAKGPVGIVLPMIVVGLWGITQSSPLSIASPSRSSLMAWFRLSRNRAAAIPCEVEDGTSIVAVRSANVAGSSENPRFLRGAKGDTGKRASHILLFQIFWNVTRRLCVVRGLIVAIAVAAPWYLWVGIRTDGEWLRGFFFEHNLGRAMTAMEGHRGGWWFYPAASLVGLFPWSLMMLPVGAWVSRHVRKTTASPAIQLGLIWMGVYMAVFSIAKTKLPSYITPSYPGAALLIGGFLSHLANRQILLSTRWLRIGAGVFASTAILVMGAIAFLSIHEQMPMVLPHLLWGIGFLGVAVMMNHVIRHGQQQRLPWAMLAAAVLFLTGLFAAAGPAAGRYRNDLQAILSEQSMVDSEGVDRPTEWMSLRAIEPSWVYYLKTPIAELTHTKTESHQLLDQTIARIAEHLRKPAARLIVDAEEIPELELALADQFQLKTRRTVAFKGFLKKNEIVVLQAAVDKLAKTDDGIKR